MADVKNDVIRICEMAVTEDVIRDKSFENVQLIGPAVIAFQGCSLDHCTFEGNPEAMLWELPPERTYVLGAVLFENCRFLNCRFTRMGITGPKGLFVMKRGGAYCRR